MSHIIGFESGPTSSGFMTWNRASLNCGHYHFPVQNYQPFAPGEAVMGQEVACKMCADIAKEVAWIKTLTRAQVHHIRFRPQFGGYYTFYKLDHTSPSGFFSIGGAKACKAVDEAISEVGLTSPVSPTEPA